MTKLNVAGLGYRLHSAELSYLPTDFLAKYVLTAKFASNAINKGNLIPFV